MRSRLMRTNQLFGLLGVSGTATQASSRSSETKGDTVYRALIMYITTSLRYKGDTVYRALIMYITTSLRYKGAMFLEGLRPSNSPVFPQAQYFHPNEWNLQTKAACETQGVGTAKCMEMG